MATAFSSGAPFYEGLSKEISGFTMNKPILASGIGQKQMNLPHTSAHTASKRL
jgi:hypothetical protein